MSNIKIMHLSYLSVLKNRNNIFFLLFLLVYTLFFNKVYAQAELQAWGNITGIRIKGELMPFETSIKMLQNNDWSKILSTGKEMQKPKYTRDSITQIVSTKLDNVFITEKVENIKNGKIKIDIQLKYEKDTTITAAFFCVDIPHNDYRNSNVSFIENKKMALSTIIANSKIDAFRIAAKNIFFNSLNRQLKIKQNDTNMLIVKANNKYIQVHIPLDSGFSPKGKIVQKTFIIEASGTINSNDVEVKLNTTIQGSEFAGLGGNFRIQNLKTDPQVIDYCLKNLRVASSRVEMPWRFWQPEKNTDPTTAAKAGKLHANVQRAMEMAQKLSQMNIPVILSAWSAPLWAIVGKPKYNHQPGDEWGNPLNNDSIADIYKSIADYIIYLKDNYAVNVALFSFNESDLGINIRQTGQQHADLIKGLGAYFVTRGLKTKLLLGDNSDATTYEFIYPALKDVSTHPYIGAVSFHSWRGWEKETLQKWADAAKQLQLPLLVAEGSIDAAAWSYPAIFEEQVYAMEEINLYIRLLNICQPLSILQWQLTSDYSPLTGAGIFGKDGPLTASQRFWNLKQLAATPENVMYMPVIYNQPNITIAALGNNTTATYALHMVNNGAARKVIVTGIPIKVTDFKMATTNKNNYMKQEAIVKVTNGKASFIVDAGTFATLTNK